MIVVLCLQITAMRRLAVFVYEPLLTLYRCTSVTALATAFFFFVALVISPMGSDFRMWTFVAGRGGDLSAILTLVAIFLGLVLGCFTLVIGFLPSRSVIWCVLANAVALFVLFLSPAIQVADCSIHEHPFAIAFDSCRKLVSNDAGQCERKPLKSPSCSGPNCRLRSVRGRSSIGRAQRSQC